MKNISPDTSTSFDNYSKHEWIDLTEYPEYPIDDDTTSVERNLQCKSIIKEWLETTRGLPSAEDFPYSGELDKDRLVSQIVNGFCLRIDNKSKVVFIPSEQIDIDSFEVAQEWVDLTNWMGDYYVPIQVDVDTQHLHLWGVITHQELKQVEKPDDEMFRYYNVDGDRTIDNLEVLWTSCELAPEPRSKNIPKLVTQGIESLIDRVKSEAGSNFDRLILQFNEWGAILDNGKYLNQYLTYQPQSVGICVTQTSKTPVENLRRWFEQTETAITELKNTSYVAFKDFYDKPALITDFIVWQNTPPALTGLLFSSKPKILDSVEKLYAIQDSTEKVNRPTNIDSPRQLLVHLMQHTMDENLRWEVAGYLWKTEPNADNNEYWHRRIKDLGLVMTGYNLRLMVAAIPLPTGYGILAHVYAIGNQSLPSNVQLTLLSEDNEQVEQVESQANAPWVRLYFSTIVNIRFSIRISVSGVDTTEAFEV
jgi:Protein of unknown function (DUF1822)